MISKAFLFAMYAHGEQKRKDGKPYIVHPVEVAVELARNGGSEELICAGFLHDTIEDAFITPEELEKSFSKRVADLVFNDSEDKSKSWEERKTEALKHLRETDDNDHKMLMCADKLANLRSVKEGLEEVGEDVWKRFKRGRKEQAWLFREMVKVLSSLEGMAMYEELKKVTEEIFKEETE